MSGVAFGSPLTSSNTNSSLLAKNGDDTAVGRITLANALTASGPTINNIQALMNANRIATGSLETDFTVAVTYGAPAATIADGSSHKAALLALARKFDPSTGHVHSGSAGDAPPISAPSLSNVPFKGYIIQGVDLVGVTGGSTDVSTQLSGFPVSSGPTSLGAVVTAPENKVLLRNSSNDAEYVDGFGNMVYARLTNSGGPTGTWTLTYYSEVVGVETPYSFGSASGVRWYYQQLFNPLNGAPTYSEFAAIPSDNATADVIVATASQYGKVILGNTSPPAVGTGSAGTANGTVANADHTHDGVESVVADLTAAKGALTFVGVGVAINQSGSGNTTFTFTVGGFPRTFTASSLTLVDNSGPTGIINVTTSVNSGFRVTYVIKRGGNFRIGRLTVISDGSVINDPQDDIESEIGDCGVTWSTTIGGGNMTLNYTTTSTGTDAKMLCEVEEMTTPT